MEVVQPTAVWTLDEEKSTLYDVLFGGVPTTEDNEENSEYGCQCGCELMRCNFCLRADCEMMMDGGYPCAVFGTQETPGLVLQT